MKESTSLNGGEFVIPQVERAFRRTVTLRSGDGPIFPKAEIFLVGCIGYYDPKPWKPNTEPDYRFSFVEQFVSKDGSGTFDIKPNTSIDGCFENDHWGDNAHEKEETATDNSPDTPEPTHPCTRPN